MAIAKLASHVQAVRLTRRNRRKSIRNRRNFAATAPVDKTTSLRRHGRKPMKSMLCVSGVLTAAALAMLPIEPSNAQQVRLIFASQSPAGTPNTVFYSNWANRVSEQSNGKLKIEVRDGETLANFITAYDRVSDDVVQIGWIIHSLVGNRFPLSDVSSLPFLGDNNVACSVASWRLYKSGLLDNEYKDIVPIWFGCLTTTYLHWAKEPKQTDDLGGAKFRVNGKIPAQATQLLGGTPISMTGGEMYEALQRGTVDGVATSWAGFEPYKLAEVTTYHLEVPISGTPSMHFMSRKKFDALPKDVQDVLKANSGEEPSRAAGAYFESAAARARAPVAASPQHKMAKLTPEQFSGWKKKVAVVSENWAKDRPNGDKAIEMFNKYYDDVLAGR
jgi:TRAP-type transport system periplasmic protein